jgi:diguanylate cyclase (GGDEF)-like protein/PAS domain S-box-containing protein
MLGSGRLLSFGGEPMSALKALTLLEPQTEAADLSSAVARFSGPAILLGSDAKILVRNIAATVLFEEDQLSPALNMLAAQVRVSQEIVIEQITVVEEPCDTVRRFDVTMTPAQGGVLVLAKETTFEANLIRALKSSRELFRDLAMCSADFAFEVDATGAFAWVSPKGALGFSPLELNGRRAATFLGDRDREPGDQPFETRSGIEDKAYWLRAADGGLRAVRLTAVPVINAVGAWKGVRGVARDVTALLHAEHRQKLTTSIVNAMRSAIEPAEMLRRASDALVEGCEAGMAWIVGLHDAPSDGAALQSQKMDDTLKEIVSRVLRESLDTPLVFTSDEWAGLGVAVSFQGETNGVILIARKIDQPLLDREAFDLLKSVAPHIGIAVAQAKAFLLLAQQSRTDPLTGLLNRRGFMEDAGRRLAALRRTGRKGALVYLDCDHFKAINDCLGHGAGDQLLYEVGRLLNAESRAGDLCVRFGGDEFGLWLEETDEPGAVAKAEAVARGFRDVSRKLSLALAVTPSIGIAEASPEGAETIEDLMSRADVGLYAAKRAGRNRMGVHCVRPILGEPEVKVQPCSRP